MPNWIILDRGRVPSDARTVEFTCLGCLAEADLPVLGCAIAQLGSGIVFDPGDHAMPAQIECPSCGCRSELE